MSRSCGVCVLAVVVSIFSATSGARAQANLPIYTDHLVNGFQDWSWAPHSNISSPVHTGGNSIAVTVNDNWQAISFHQADFDVSVYSNFAFWASGGASGGQRLQVVAQFGPGDTNSGPAYALPALSANTWQKFVIPLTALGVANKTNVNRFNIQLTTYGTSGTFYLDDVELTSKPAPALVHLSVNATQALRSVDSRWFGFNTAIWDGNFDTPTTISLFKEIGAQIMRFPGGSISDTYHWRSNYVVGSIWQGWPTWFTNFAHVATNIGAQAFITVNYGSGTSAEAADWVRFSNVTNRYGFKHWEIGNENYGTWEFDINTNAPYHSNDAWTYAQRAVDYVQQMKAADPTIRVGVVVAPGENSFSNSFAPLHPAVNPRTGRTNYGWTPILLSSLKNLGATPDFAVHHRYPQYSSSGSIACADSDPLLLQSTTGWASDASDLRQQITDYFGPAGTNIELLCTENNSDAGAQGRQSTSLVNGLYYAESLAQLMRTELNAFVWWDFRNGSPNDGSFDPTLYGWRTVGDLGMIGDLSTKYPPFYAAKLMQYFAQPGDMILGASTDFLLLQSYAARRASGALSLLVVNRDTATNFNAQINLSSFAPGATALLRFYGIAQDEAARTNGTAAAQDIATNIFAGANTTFTYSFPPLSLTLFTLAPAAPTLAVLPPPPQSDDQFVFQLQGQARVSYLIQSSTNLTNWTTSSTNTLAGPTLNFTNPVPAGTAQAFWRAVWQP